MSEKNELSGICETWLRAALTALQSLPFLPGYEDIDVTFRPDGGYSTQTTSTKIYSSFLIRNYRNWLFGLPEFEDVLKIVVRAPALASALFPRTEELPSYDLDQQKNILETYFGRFLIEYVKTKQDLAFAESNFKSILTKLEEYLYSTEPITTTTLIHLRNVRSEVKEASLAKNVFLRQTTYEEKKEAVKSALARQEHGDIPETVLGIQHLIAPQEDLPVSKQQEVYDIANAVAFALRLMKPEHVELGKFHWHITDQPFRGEGGMSWSLIRNIRSFDNSSYILTAEDIDVLTKLWPRAKKAYKKAELLIAISRFEGSYLRHILQDMLIDYWIGLEALFLPPEMVREMKEAVALAVSNYLGKTSDERDRIYKEVMSSHEIRGKVVHGKPVEEKRLIEFTTKTGELLRHSLWKRIEE